MWFDLRKKVLGSYVPAHIVRPSNSWDTWIVVHNSVYFAFILAEKKVSKK